MKEFLNIIDGQVRGAASGRTTDIVNPSTGLVYARAAQSDTSDVDVAFKSSAEAFERWRWSTPRERQLALLRLATIMEDRADEIIALECENTGKPPALFRQFEMEAVLDSIRFFAGAARNLEGRAQAEYVRGYTSSIRREPIGPVAGIAPWNYPLYMSLWKVIAPIAAGCSVVLKPSDTTPASSFKLVEWMQEVVPKGICNLVCGDRSTGEALVAHPVPAMVSITGSVRAGMAVAASASRDLKRAHLELGGNAPSIVFKDADIEAAVKGISAAGLANGGQDCTAATRVLVQVDIYEDFVYALRDAVAEKRTGFDPSDEAIDYGPINNPTQLAHISGLVDRTPDHAEVLCGGLAVDGPGFFYRPTLVADLKQADELVQTEIFGPVLTAQPFRTEEEAVEMANGTPYGLSSSVWTGSGSTAARMTARMDFGTVWVNTHHPLTAEMPHGGFKHSGYGKDMSMYGFEDYTRIKHVMQHHGFEG